MRTDNINIAEILKKQPRGTKLYSPICGDLFLDHIDDDEDIIYCRTHDYTYVRFMGNGRYCGNKEWRMPPFPVKGVEPVGRSPV